MVLFSNPLTLVTDLIQLDMDSEIMDVWLKMSVFKTVLVGAYAVISVFYM